MDFAFRNAEIDLIMEEFVIEEECGLSKHKEEICTPIDNEHRRRKLGKSLQSARYYRRLKYVRGRSVARCSLCRPRRIKADTARLYGRNLESNLAIALNELTDQMDITEWEKSDTIRDLIVKDVNKQLTKYLKSAWKRRVTSKKHFNVVCYIDED
eukprot:scaffold73704_cov71-Attheya_sp.AAC.1